MLPFLLVALAIPILVSLGLGLRAWRIRRSSPAPDRPGRADRRWISDLATAAAILALAAVGGVYEWNAYTSRFLDSSFKRWKEIGRPFPEFAEGVHKVGENASAKALLADLRPYGAETLYGSGSRTDSKLPWLEASSFFQAVLESKSRTQDKIGPLPEKAPRLAAMTGDLDRLYRQILSRPPPVWASDPGAGFFGSAPDFLFLRKLLLTIGGDSVLRLANGDPAGAAEAVAAGRRVLDGLRENPGPISCMIRPAFASILIPASVRLPEEADGWEQLAREANSLRDGLKNSIQRESVIFLNYYVHDHPEDAFSRVSLFGIGPLPRWTGRFVNPLTLRRECAQRWMTETGMLDCWDRKDLLTAADLGEKEVDRLCGRYPSLSAANFTRAWHRLNLILVKQEQAEIIRFARAQMASGKLGSPTKHPSVVLPGATWEIIPDIASRSVALKLTPTPGWVKDSPLTPPDFFLLPLDGSRSWKFDGDWQRTAANSLPIP